MARIDLNSDLGESFGAWTMGDDAAMLEIVTSANVACGFHAGDPAGILQTLREAARRGVSIGAHVAYPDLSGFGRRNMDVASADLRAGVIYQIGALQALARVAGTQVRYVKPHGALYNTIAHDRRQATDGCFFIICVRNLIRRILAPIVYGVRSLSWNIVLSVNRHILSWLKPRLPVFNHSVFVHIFPVHEHITINIKRRWCRLAFFITVCLAEVLSRICSLKICCIAFSCIVNGNRYITASCYLNLLWNKCLKSLIAFACLCLSLIAHISCESFVLS